MDAAVAVLAVATQALNERHGMKSWAPVDERYFRNLSFFDGSDEG